MSMGLAVLLASSIVGTVTFQGEPPAPARVDMGHNDPKCAAMHPEGASKRTILVHDGRLANAFVWLKGGVSGDHPPPIGRAVLDQRGCFFIPHVLGVRKGQAITIRNSDETLHSIHARPGLNAEFHLGQPRIMQTARTFDKPELMIPISCAVHPWMGAYVSVVDHPYFAVTGRDGTFEIPDVPPGEYEIEVVHEELKSQSRPITVGAEQKARADFAFK